MYIQTQYADAATGDILITPHQPSYLVQGLSVTYLHSTEDNLHVVGYIRTCSDPCNELQRFPSQ